MARQLAAILAADVVGYSAMMARSESDTLSRLIAFRKTIVDPAVRTHNGRLVKLMGDGALVEFASVVDAVRAAISIQSDVARDSEAPIRLRIGINLGDVIRTGDDIYGDGVNIAARLETLAAPGGICIAGSVRQSLGNRIDVQFSDGGLQNLKNMDTPIQVFHWHPEARDTSETPAPPSTDVSRASIAVLAFDNMTTDPEQEYFSDGIAEDIITALSHFRDFFVIARNTTFTYKGRAIRVDEVCRDLGVRYLMEGSVRKAGGKVRVTAQLIDGRSGAHIWAEKYDRELDDIFAVQDEITQAIVSAVAPETIGAETRRARHQRPDNLSAWDMLLQARWHLGKFAREHNEAARDLLRKAKAADPDNGDIHAALALCDLMAMLHDWRSDTKSLISAAKTSAETAVQLDEQNANAHGMLGMANAFAREFDACLDHLNRAVELNPNLAIGYGNLAAYYGISHQFEESRACALRAMALSPRDPLKAFWRGGLGIGAYVAEDYDACVANARDGLKEHPGFASLMRQEAAALAMLGQPEEAAASINRVLEVMPGLTIAKVRHIVPVRHPQDWDRWLDGLRRAGLPEE